MGPEWNFDPDDDPRQLDVTDLERIERFKEAGHGGSVADGRLAAVDLCGVDVPVARLDGRRDGTVLES